MHLELPEVTERSRSPKSSMYPQRLQGVTESLRVWDPDPWPRQLRGLAVAVIGHGMPHPWIGLPDEILQAPGSILAVIRRGPTSKYNNSHTRHTS